MPAWYRLIRAARFLQVEPWVLYEQPSYWRDLAYEAERAEVEAAEAATKRAMRRKG